MNRIKEYFEFEARFLGLGYMLLWPVIAHDNSIVTLNTPIFCGENAYLPFAPLCHLSHAVHLSPGLHLIGLMSASYVVGSLALRRLRRWRRVPAANDVAMSVSASRIDAMLPPAPRPTRAKPLCPLRPVRPRKTFGLRGTEPCAR